MFTADKVGEPMKVALDAKAAKAWFGAPPPDLSVIARSRGADWLYTYLRSFYRDPKTATGWNNVVFPNVGMPHALWTLQGERGCEEKDGGRSQGRRSSAEARKGTPVAVAEYDATVRDLVNFLVYIGEPSARASAIGIVVLFVLGRAVRARLPAQAGVLEGRALVRGATRRFFPRAGESRHP